MKNERPIFINAFAHGGSNILWNIFQSHPDVCSPLYETHVLFTRGRINELATNTILRLGNDPNIFKGEEPEYNSSLSKISKTYIDRSLYRAKFKNLKNEFNRYKTPSKEYTAREIRKTRLVCKEVSKSPNTARFGVPLFQDMYPNATFFGLMRNGLALCESYLRRNISRTPIEAARIYNYITTRIIEYSQKYSNFHIIKFEDVLTNPNKTAEQVYSLAALDSAKVDKIRLKDKRNIDNNN